MIPLYASFSKCLPILVAVNFHINFRIKFFLSTKDIVGILINHIKSIDQIEKK